MNARLSLPLALLLLGCAAPAGAVPCQLPDIGETAEAARNADAVAVVVPLQEASAPDVPERTFEEALDEAEERARRSGGGVPVGGGAPFAVERTLSGMTPSRLRLPPPPCAADAYLLVMPSGQPPVLFPLTGAEDAAILEVEAALASD